MKTITRDPDRLVVSFDVQEGGRVPIREEVRHQQAGDRRAKWEKSTVALSIGELQKIFERAVESQLHLPTGTLQARLVNRKTGQPVE